MKNLIFFLIVLTSLSAWPRDLTHRFHQYYDNGSEKILSEAELEALSQHEIVLVNGIMSEFFIREFVPNFAWVTSAYFEAQEKHFQGLGLSVTKVAPSSFLIAAAFDDVAGIFPALKKKNRKGVLMVHSLGGLLILDHLLAHPGDQAWVAGIIFLQSPFHGSPMADILTYAPLDTLEYLKVSSRKKIMGTKEKEIREILARIPVLTVGTVANQTRSLFKPSVMIMRYGCPVPVAGICLPPKFYRGPYLKSDGMVPLQSSHLFEADHVTLKTVDHGETVMNLPFQSIVKSRMSEVLMKMLIER